MDEKDTKAGPLPVVGQARRPDPSLAGDTLDGGASGAPPATPEELRERVIEVLRTVFDPEIPVNVYDLGLVYEIDVGTPGRVAIKMTLTAPACPVAGEMPPFIETQLRRIPGIEETTVEIVWDPPWTPARMSEAAKLQLGML